MQKNISVIIQARLNSKRFPGKVLKEISGKPLIFYVTNQILKLNNIEKIIIATSTSKKDDKIVKYCIKNNLEYFRGSEKDVLDRFYQCAKQFKLKNIIRISADSPLIDHMIIKNCTKKFFSQKYDYVSNIIKNENKIWVENFNGYPRGCAVEIFSFATLEYTWKKASSPNEREHVTDFMWKNNNLFKLGNIKSPRDFSSINLEVNFKKDFYRISKIIEKFSNTNFTMNKINKFLK